MASEIVLPEITPTFHMTFKSYRFETNAGKPFDHYVFIYCDFVTPDQIFQYGLKAAYSPELRSIDLRQGIYIFNDKNVPTGLCNMDRPSKLIENLACRGSCGKYDIVYVTTESFLPNNSYCDLFVRTFKRDYRFVLVDREKVEAEKRRLQQRKKRIFH